MPKSVLLSSAQALLIDRLVAEGQDASTAEAVAAGIALRLDREDQFATLRAAWQEGVESGDDVPLDVALNGPVGGCAVRATTCP